MNTQTNIVALVASAPIADTLPSNVIDLRGIAEAAYNAENGKTKFLAMADAALGDAPDEETVKTVRLEIVVGITASRLPADAFPRKTMSIAERLDFARKLVTEGQAPTEVSDGTPAKLRKGNTCFRTGVQHRTIRNAEQRASKYLAELGEGNAKTDAQDNASRSKRKGGGNPAPHHGKGESAPTPPTHEELVKPQAPVDGVSYAATLLNMLSTAMQYDNKHAKVRPIEYGEIAEGLASLHALALKCDAAYHVRLTAQDAEKVEASTARKARKAK